MGNLNSTIEMGIEHSLAAHALAASIKSGDIKAIAIDKAIKTLTSQGFDAKYATEVVEILAILVRD